MLEVHEGPWALGVLAHLPGGETCAPAGSDCGLTQAACTENQQATLLYKPVL